MSSKIDMVDKWIQELIYPGKVEDFVKSTKNFKSKEGHHKEYVFYTDEYKYKILAIDRKEDDTYLGCQVSARKARAGEDWHRGNDLPDGHIDEGTWTKILNAIINYELVELSKFKRPDSIPE